MEDKKSKQYSLDNTRYSKATPQKIYWEIEKETINIKETPMIEESKTFYSNIWNHKKSYNKKQGGLKI